MQIQDNKKFIKEVFAFKKFNRNKTHTQKKNNE